MEETARLRLSMVALAQRRLSIGLGILVAVAVLGGAAIAVCGRDAEFVAKAVVVLVTLYMAAATLQLSHAQGDTRGLRITLTCLVLFVPFASLVVPLVLLWRARRMLRAEAIEAGFFTVRRAEMAWLVREPGAAMVCLGCGYDLAGIGERAACPECGRVRE